MWDQRVSPLLGPSRAFPYPESLRGFCGCCKASSWLPVLLEPLSAPGKVSPHVLSAAVFQSWDQHVLKVACSLLSGVFHFLYLSHMETVLLMVMKPFRGNQTSPVQHSNRRAHQPLSSTHLLNYARLSRRQPSSYM